MTADHDHPEPLSADGARRRDAILTHAQQALAGRVRTRWARRTRGVLAMLAGVIGLLVYVVPQPVTLQPREVVRVERPAAMSEPAAPIEIERLDDNAMLSALAALGVDAGLVEIDGEQRLVARDGSPLELARPRREGERGVPRGGGA